MNVAVFGVGDHVLDGDAGDRVGLGDLGGMDKEGKRLWVGMGVQGWFELPKEKP